MTDEQATARPCTVHEVSRRVASGEQRFDPAVREFLDVFYSRPAERHHALAECPVPLDALKDAYLAAVAEHLSSDQSMSPPAWAAGYGFGLRRPFFAGGLESLKAALTAESPAAFRRRMRFVSRNALSRPRREPDQQAPPLSSAPGVRRGVDGSSGSHPPTS